MNAVLLAALANAVLAVPLAVLAYAAGRLVNRPALTHALWVLVLLKLLTPPLLEIPMIPAHLAPRLAGVVADSPSAPVLPIAASAAVADGLDDPAAAHVAPADSSPAEANATPTVSKEVVAAAGLPAAVPTAGESVAPVPGPPSGERGSIRPGIVVSFVWLAGAVVVFGMQAYRLTRYRRVLRTGVESPELSRHAAELAAAMGLKSPPRVRLLPGVVSPMLWGVGPRATILFPAALAGRLDQDARGSLLVHELAHFGRGDQWVRLLELAAGVFYWWHPAVWLARRGLEQAGEDCADAWVVERFRSRPRCYAAALLDTVDFLASGPSAVVPGVTGLGTAAALRHRLTRIMQGPAPRALSRPARAGVLLLLLTLPLQPALFEMAGSRGLASVSAELDPTAFFTPEEEPEAREPAGSRDVRPRASMGEPLAPLPGSHVWAAPSSPDGTFALEVRLDGSATLRDVRGGRAWPLPSAPSAADFSPDGRALALAGAGGVTLRDLAGGAETVLTRSGSAVHSVSYSPAGDRLAIGGDDGVTIHALDGSGTTVLPSIGAPAACVRFSEDGRSLVAVTGHWASVAGGRVLIWDGRAWSDLETGFRAAVAAYTPAGLVVAAWDGRAVVYDVKSGEPLGTAQVAKDAVSAAEFCRAAGGLTRLTFEREWPALATGGGRPRPSSRPTGFDPAVFMRGLGGRSGAEDVRNEDAAEFHHRSVTSPESILR